ncbi:MAG TPA: lipoprotein-releasing ABC transporter permease subunit [Steroidobacteraceae bacterium]|nr:lipoprotein-releasing ABC transporter permease subunit [Steroidobacteraceae bacterium]
MFQPLSLFVGLRYAGARAHRFFVSFITWVALGGVAVGVAALIVILSVMNGFEGELRTRLLALSAPVRLTAAEDRHVDWDALATRIGGVAGVKSAEPYAELQVLAVHQPEMQPLQLRAAGPAIRSELKPLLVEGDAVNLDDQSLILGRLLAEQLGVAAGDSITLLILTVTDAGVPEPRLREFTVSAVFEAGIQDHDGALAFASPETLEALGAAHSGSKGLSVQVANAMSAPGVAQQIRETLTGDLAGVSVGDWTEEHASYFRAIKIEKTMMALILLLVVGVATFNIVAMLVMVVTDKRTDIAILRTLGAGPGAVARVFITQGLIIGWLGVAAGLALGIAIARNVGPITRWLESTFGLRLFDADVFYNTQVPSEIHRLDVLLVAGSALLVTAMATIYPARRAAAVSPAEALRYE